MSYIIIDGVRREYTSEKNILEIVRKAGIELPALCYHRELPVSGACKLCMVEDGEGNFLPACSTPPQEGMRIRTHSEALDKHRKDTLESLLKDHAGDCAACEKSDECKLKEYALRYGAQDVRFPAPAAAAEDGDAKNIVRDFDKCISCGSCVSVCSTRQGIGAIAFAAEAEEDGEERSAPRLAVSDACVECGQCAAVCPTGALTVKNETERAWELLRRDKRTTRVVVQVAPAVRVAIGEYFGLARGEDAMGKIAAALRLIGADVVADGAYGEDLVTLAEAEELRARLSAGEHLPLIVSSCPAWVRYAESTCPEIVSALSSCRSPMQAFGAVLRNHYDGLDDGRETKIIAVTPCAAAKYEAARAEFAQEGTPATDLVLTTGELAKMFKRAGIRLRLLKNEPCDAPFDVHTGSGLLAGVTGGAAEALLRCLSEDRSPEFLRRLEYSGVRGRKERKEARVEIDGREWKIAVVSGLKAAGECVKQMQSGDAEYAFVEAAACPGGCIAGGGQPCTDEMTEKLRATGLYYLDRQNERKSAAENPAAVDLYRHLSAKEKHAFLHVSYAVAEGTETVVPVGTKDTAQPEEPSERGEAIPAESEPEEPIQTEESIETAAPEEEPTAETEETPEDFPEPDETEDFLEEEAPLEELFEEPAFAEEEIALAEAPAADELPVAENMAATDEIPVPDELPVAEELNDVEEVCAPEETDQTAPEEAQETAAKEQPDAPAPDLEGEPENALETQAEEEAAEPAPEEAMPVAPEETPEETAEEGAAQSEETEETAVPDEPEEAETPLEEPVETSDRPEESLGDETAEGEETEDPSEPYHTTLSRKERRKLKRMKKFRH